LNPRSPSLEGETRDGFSLSLPSLSVKNTSPDGHIQRDSPITIVGTLESTSEMSGLPRITALELNKYVDTMLVQ